MAKRGADVEDLHLLENSEAEALGAIQGPFPPWCLGSTFAPPQLVTSDLCPLIFNRVGKPECIISTGHEVERQEGTDLKTSEQTKSFLLSSSAPFIPSGLLHDHLEEDAALQKADSKQKKRYPGNRLESIKCMDGNIVLFFPCGKTGEKIGSSLCYPRVDGAWYPIRKSPAAANCDDPDETHLSVSPSFGQPILQLSAVMMQPDVDCHGHICVAARTLYQVYFCIVLREVDCIRSVATFAATFRTHVSHVTWNPHLDREAAVLLENGEVSLFDVPVPKIGHTNRIMDVKAKVTLENPACSLRAKCDRGGSASALVLAIVDARKEDTPKDDLEEFRLVDELWWRCEFAWHPQILLVSGLRTIVQMDYRGKRLSDFSVHGAARVSKRCRSDISILAEVGSASTLSRFCHMRSTEERIVSFARAEYDGMCKFSVATEKHLMLFDTRRVGAPILQWEHGMSEEPPDLLIMLRTSNLQSCVDEGKRRKYNNGRAIVAVSFQSGDIGLFFYGSRGTSAFPERKDYSTVNDFEGYDWDDTTFAWEMPVRIHPPRPVAKDWSDLIAFSDVQLAKKVDSSFENRLECISGITILSHHISESSASNPKKGFTILQLTGSGDILFQLYEASDQFAILPGVRTGNVSRAQDEKEVWEAQKPKFLVLRAFFRYMQTGCTIACSDADEGKFSNRPDDGASLDVTNNPEEGMTRDSTEVTEAFRLEKEKNMIDTQLKSHLKTVLHNLSVPLSMFEVAHTVLRMQLPSSWLPSVAGLPSDLEAQSKKGYKWGSFLPLIYSGPPSESDDQEIARKLVSPVPLSSLLEIQYRMKLEGNASTKSDCENVDLKLRGNVVSGDGEEEGLAEGVDRPEHSSLGKKIVPGQKLFQEACSKIENGTKEFVETQVPSVVSLGDFKEDWLKSELDGRIVLYGISTDTFNKPETIDNLTPVDKIRNSENVAEFDEDVDEELGRSFNRKRVFNFIGGKSLTSQEKIEGNRLTNMDTEICPIKLTYSSRLKDIERTLEMQLEEQEWTTLESLQAQLRDWQQSLEIYSTKYR